MRTLVGTARSTTANSGNDSLCGGNSLFGYECDDSLYGDGPYGGRGNGLLAGDGRFAGDRGDSLLGGRGGNRRRR